MAASGCRARAKSSAAFGSATQTTVLAGSVPAAR